MLLIIAKCKAQGTEMLLMLSFNGEGDGARCFCDVVCMPISAAGALCFNCRQPIFWQVFLHISTVTKICCKQWVLPLGGKLVSYISISLLFSCMSMIITWIRISSLSFCAFFTVTLGFWTPGCVFQRLKKLIRVVSFHYRFTFCAWSV